MDARPDEVIRDQSRPLGEQERMLHYVHNIGGLIATQVLHLRGPLDTRKVRQAFDWLQRRHGMLRAHIEQRGLGIGPHFPFIYRKFWWVTEGTTEIPVRHAEGDWRDIVQQEQKTRFPSGNNPRLRVTLVSEGGDLHHLLVTADHAIGDAQAALMASRELLDYFADPDAAPLTNDTRLPPAMESGHTPSSNPARPYEPAWRLPVKPLYRNKPVTLFDKRTLSVDETTAFNAAVRARRATVHGAVTAAVLQAAGTRFGMKTMTSLSNVEFRKLMKPPVPNETYGCYIDVMRTTHDAEQPYWKLAADVAFKLITAIARHQHQASVLKMPEADWYRNEFWSTLKTDGCTDAFAITTGGDSRLAAKYGDLVLEDMDVVISLNPVGPAIYVLVVERLGRLTIQFCYAARRISAEDATAILDSAYATLRAVPAD